MGNCKYFRVRQKNYKKILYCLNRKQEIGFSDCVCCETKETKKQKPIKKVRATKETVSEKTYQNVFERDMGTCQICGSQRDLQLHHICGRGKNLTDNENNCIMLCMNCHHNVVHKNNKFWRPKLLEKIKEKMQCKKL